MRAISSPFLRAMLVAVAAPLIPLPATAQVGVTVPRWTAVPEWSANLSSEGRGIGFAPTAAVGRSDTIVVPLLVARELLFIDERGVIARTVGDLGRLSAVGYIGDTLWVADGSNRRFRLLARNGLAQTRSYEQMFGPDYADGDPSRTHWTPIGLTQGGRVLALTEMPLTTRSVDVTSPERGRLLLRDPKNGRVDTLGYVFTIRGAMQVSHPGTPALRMTNPFRYRDLVAMDGLGARIVLVRLPSPTDTVPPSDLEVTAWNADGSLAFRRVLPVKLRPITAAELSSAISSSSFSSGGGGDARVPIFPDERSAVKAANPPGSMIAPIDRVVVGRDKTVWMREDSDRRAGSEWFWLVLSADGVPLARVSLPRGHGGNILAADAGNVWALESSDLSDFAIVRYRISRTPDAAIRP